MLLPYVISPPASAYSRSEHIAGTPWRPARRASWTRRALKKASLPTKRASGRSRTIVAKAASISRLVLALRTSICSPLARAADSTSLNVDSVLVAWVGLMSTATRAAPGTSSRRSSSRFAVNSPTRKLTPVKLPPGRARLATRPSLTGSSPTMKAMGIVAVAALAVDVTAMPPLVAITATCRRTRSAASAGSRSNWFSAQRYTIATFSPSTYPVSFRPWRNARNRSVNASGDLLSRNPITGIAGCCPRAGSGHAAAAPPSRVMNSRRFMPNMGLPPIGFGLTSVPISARGPIPTPCARRVFANLRGRFLSHLHARRTRSVPRLILPRSPRPAPVDRLFERPAEHEDDEHEHNADHDDLPLRNRASRAHARGHPHASCRGEPVHVMAFLASDNNARAEKPDARHDALNHAALLGAGRRVDRQNGQGRAEAHEAERAHPGLLAV